MTPDTIALRRLSAAQAINAVEALTDVLIDCVQGGASVSFMWPLPREKALAFWRRVVEAWPAGCRGSSRSRPRWSC
jgi:hypothetical protein